MTGLRYVAVACAAMWAGAMPAEAQGTTPWTVTEAPDTLYAQVCAAGDSAANPKVTCFGVSCLPETADFDYVLSTAFYGAPEVFRGMILADGRQVGTVTFSQFDDDAYGGLYLGGADAATKAAIAKAFATARRVGVVPDPAVPGFEPVADLPMDGAVAALTDFGSRCTALAQARANERAGTGAAGAPAVPTGATPDTDPSRFVIVGDIAPRADDLAYKVAANEIYTTDRSRPDATPLDIEGRLVPFADGRQVLFVRICHPILFGRNQCETTRYLAAGAGMPFREIGTVIAGYGYLYLDTKAGGADGLPDILIMGSLAGVGWQRIGMSQ